MRSIRRKRFAAGAACALMLGAAAPARAELRVLRLGETPGLHLSGGQFVAAAGDVNGDGRGDLLVMEGFRDDSRGRVNVVFGNPGNREVDLDEPGDWGFVIDGAQPGDSAAIAAGAGDVNGDGLADVVVGAPDADKAYVVFGKTTHEAVSLLLFDANVQGSAGYRVDGAGGLFGRTVAGLGDLNGDGLSDVAVGAPFDGATYVLFGKTDSLPYDVSLLELDSADGFVVTTPVPETDDGYGVAGPGDVNGDGIPDIVVGVFDESVATSACCRSWVVFGKAEGTRVSTRRLGDGGFKIAGGGGGSVARVGDVNGDGLADIGLAGAVVFGSASTRTIKTSDLGKRGWLVRGRFVVSTSGAGDVNGDGRDDLLVGDLGARFAGVDSGSTYLIRGKGTSRSVDLRRTTRGWRIDGEGARAYSGTSVAGPGDFDGDGIPDLAIGAPGPRSDTPGDAYVVWGRRR